MASCEQCGKKATLVYNRAMRVLPYKQRVFCDDCFDSIQRKEELFAILSLFAIFFMVIAAIALIYFSGEKQDQARDEQIEAYYDERDMNEDGRLDFWEETATESMRLNFKKHGYPWKTVLRPGDSGERLKFMVHREDLVRLAQREGFNKNFSFPDLMTSYFAKLTDPESPMQLRRVFVTLDDQIVFVVHQFPQTPQGGFTQEYFDAAQKTQGDTPAEGQKLEPTEVLICAERLSSSKINDMMGIEDNTYHIEDSILVEGPDKKKKKLKP